MNRRKIWITIGCLMIAAGMAASAEAGGRKRPGVAPPPAPQPAGTTVTVVNKTSKNLFTVIYDPPPFLFNVGEAKAKGGKIVNAGSTAVFTNVKAGENDIEVYDLVLLGTPITDATSLVHPNAPGDQLASGSVDAVANKNTTVEVSIVGGNLQFTPK